ncbi:hypothetical protein [Streptococcus parasanguinis]|uniref:hypothetical protein n=1 Tax=Streptococcus parasanguinis TaxID=1318 RepID=UPI0009BA09C0|nr:hypothetical protein [Streptococcus parasanguinis]
MMLSLEQLISIIGSVGISAIIGTTFTFIQFNKKNRLDFITTERAEWRKQLKQILMDLSDTSKRERAVMKLKSQINPYGKNMDIKYSKPYYMKDGHIWDIVDHHKIDYEILSLYIELLLKYDWERSKQEIKFNPSTLFRWFIWLLLLVLSIYSSSIIFGKTNNLHNGLYSMIFIVAIVSIICILLQFWVTNYIKSVPSRHKREQLWIFFIFYAFPYATTFLCLFLNSTFLQSNLLKIFALIGLFIYEFYYLSLIESVEDDYMREIERHTSVKSDNYKQGIAIENSVQKLEKALYGFSYDKQRIKSLKKRKHKLEKKLDKKVI